MASLLSAGASLLGGVAGGKGAEKAAKTQAAAYQQGINEQQREFNQVQTNNQPYMAAGKTSLDSILNLLGLGSGGTTGQQSAIDALKASPTYTSEFGSGLDALNQSAAATGGLRGGNNALNESNFGSQLLASVLQGQIGNLGSLVNVGQAATGGTNSAALSTGNNISSLLGQQGSASASSAAAPYAAFQNILSGLGSSGFGIGGSGNSLESYEPTLQSNVMSGLTASNNSFLNNLAW